MGGGGEAVWASADLGQAGGRRGQRAAGWTLGLPRVPSPGRLSRGPGLGTTRRAAETLACAVTAGTPAPARAGERREGAPALASGRRRRRRPLPTRPLSACRPEEEARRRPRPGREEAWLARARPRQCARSPFRIRPSVRVSDPPSSLSLRPRQVQGGTAPASVRAPLPRPGCEPGRGSGSGIPGGAGRGG